jgi:transposase
MLILARMRRRVGMAVEITRREHSVGKLRREAARAKDGRAARRMLALALVLEGKSRTEAAEHCGMDRQTLRDWVHRYNEEGLAGLTDRPLSGRPPLLTPTQMAELKTIVEQGADPAVHGVVRFRRIDLCAIMEHRFGVRLAERTMGSLLAKLGFGRLSVRPQHPRSDPEAQELYKKLRRPGGAGVARRGQGQAARDLVSG